ncbi:MAG TPA: hypothetical protein VMG38_20590 [Trebonia sp.]|nr:hypothetical protein [Trebonia sp.]
MTAQDERPAAPQDERPPAAPQDERPPAAGPVLPEQSREDTDEGWGEYPGRDDDWLRRDRPPHWADF